MGYKSTHVRYTLIKREGDKTFSDYIQTTKEAVAEKGILIKSCKLPRKLKKKLKNLFSWEFEVGISNIETVIEKEHLRILNSRGFFVGDTNE